MYAPYVPVFGYFGSFTMTFSQRVCHFLGKENCIRLHYDRSNSNFNSVPHLFISRPNSHIINSHIFYPTCAKTNKHAQGQFKFSKLRACLHGGKVPRLEGLGNSPPLHATHLTETVSGLRGFKQNGRPKKLYFHLLSASCTDTGLFSA